MKKILIALCLMFATSAFAGKVCIIGSQAVCYTEQVNLDSLFDVIAYVEYPGARYKVIVEKDLITIRLLPGDVKEMKEFEERKKGVSVH